MKILLKVFSLFLILFSFLSIFNISVVNSNEIIDGDSSPIHYCQGNDAYGNPKCSLEAGLEQTKGIEDLETEQDASEYFQNIVKYLLSFLYLIAVILIIYAGFNILTAGGDEEKAKKTKTMIVYVIIGLLIIFLAGPIVNLLLNILGDSSSTINISF